MIAGPVSKPLMHLWCLMSAVVIQDQMDVEMRRDLPADLSQKAQEFLLAVPFGGDFPWRYPGRRTAGRLDPQSASGADLLFEVPNRRREPADPKATETEAI